MSDKGKKKKDPENGKKLKRFRERTIVTPQKLIGEKGWGFLKQPWKGKKEGMRDYQSTSASHGFQERNWGEANSNTEGKV